MRSPYSDGGRVRGSLAHPHRDQGYSSDPVGETVCRRLTMIQLVQEWADALAELEPEPPRTRHNRARRQHNALTRANVERPAASSPADILLSDTYNRPGGST